MPNSPLEDAKHRLPLPALMAQYGKGHCAKKSARCMFHDDSHNSFSAFQHKDGAWAWKCHAGCGGGDEIDWLAKMLDRSNADACREYIHLAGVAPSPSSSSTPPPAPPTQPPFDWQSCVIALGPEHRRDLAKWRGYEPEFVERLHAQNLIGLFNGTRIAFPVCDANGHVHGCHYRLKEDGSWRYHPSGTRAAPFIIGDLATAKTILLFESQWDLSSVLNLLGWHIQPLANTAAIATRGASNGRFLAGLCRPDAIVFAFAQNDPAGKKWLVDVAVNCGCKCFHAVVPKPHKDVNDWMRVGATADDIRRAMAEALLVAVPVATELHAASPQSIPEISSLADDIEPKPFPLDALPAVMAAIVAGVARAERVPVALPAVCALGMASGTIGAGLEVVSGPNRVTRANLYLLASAESGSGKSETFRIVAAPLLDYQARQLETWKLKTSPQLQSEIRVLEKEIAALERKAANASDPMDREQLRSELESKLAHKDEAVAHAAMPCMIAQDVTTECLAVLLRDNHEVIFSTSADARKLVDNLMGRYNPSKTTDESLYLAAYSGDYVRVDRQGRDPVVLKKPCLSLCWLIQPDLLDTILGKQSLSVGGFLPRFLVCHTRATPRRIEGEPQILSESTREQWKNRLDELLATFHSAKAPFRVTVTPEAKAIMTDYHNRIVDRRSSDLFDVTAFAARYAENAWRVAVVLHGVHWGAAAGHQPLGAETASNAVRIVEWFAEQQLEILGKGRCAAAAASAGAVLKLLSDRMQGKFLEQEERNRGCVVDYVTSRTVYRARITPMAEAATVLLERMVADGLLSTTDIVPVHGGKTMRIYRAVKNPVPG